MVQQVLIDVLEVERPIWDLELLVPEVARGGLVAQEDGIPVFMRVPVRMHV